jgi:hypothetical protein
MPADWPDTIHVQQRRWKGNVHIEIKSWRISIVPARLTRIEAVLFIFLRELENFLLYEDGEPK